MLERTSARVRNFATLGVFLVTCALVCGCSGRRASVQGSVTFKDLPVDGGRIFFLPDGEPAGRPAVHAIIRQGKYYLPSAEGPEFGRHRVEIVWHKKPGKQGSGATDPGLVTDDMQQTIPAAYNSRTTLVADVQRGSNTFDFALKDPP